MRTLSSNESLYRSLIYMADKGNAILVEKTWGGGLAGPLGSPQSSGESHGLGGALDWGWLPMSLVSFLLFLSL